MSKHNCNASIESIMFLGFISLFLSVWSATPCQSNHLGSPILEFHVVLFTVALSCIKLQQGLLTGSQGVRHVVAQLVACQAQWETWCHHLSHTRTGLLMTFHLPTPFKKMLYVSKMYATCPLFLLHLVRSLTKHVAQVRPARCGVLLSAWERSRRHPDAVPHQRGRSPWQRCNEQRWKEWWSQRGDIMPQ